MDPLPCGMKMGEKGWKGYENGQNMVDPLHGIKMVSSGSKNLITLVIPWENGKHGIKRYSDIRSFPWRDFGRNTSSLIND